VKPDVRGNELIQEVKTPAMTSLNSRSTSREVDLLRPVDPLQDCIQGHRDSEAPLRHPSRPS
jgi:hypothetical protein